MRVLIAFAAAMALAGCGLQPMYAGGGSGKVARGLEFRSERRQSIFMSAQYEDPRAIEINTSGQATT